jgi:protocatechuate 3,4-dioxygenase beta subunit
MRPLHTLLVLVGLVLVVGGAWLVLRDDEPASAAVAPATAQPAPASATEALVAPAGGDEAPREERVAQKAPPTAPAPAPAVAAAVRGTALRGQVVDPAGAPVAGARVMAASDDGFGLSGTPLDVEGAERLPWLKRYDAVTDAEGRFELRGPEPGELRLAVRAAGFAPWDQADVVLPSGDAHELDPIRLELSVVLTGRVVDPDGRAVAGAELQRFAPMEGGIVFGGGLGASGVRVATTDVDGSFTVDQLAAGSYTLRVSHEAHPDRYETGKTHTPGQRVGGLTIVVEYGYEIAGRVLGAPGGSESTLIVRATPDRGGERALPLNARAGVFPAESRRADVAADGSFLVRGVREGQAYMVSARKRPSDRGGFLGFFGRSLSPRVAAHAGDRGVELPFQPEGALVFQVVDAQTREPVTSFQVSAGTGFLMPLLGDDGRVVREHPDGRARFGNLRPTSDEERFSLKISATGYRDELLEHLTVTVGEETDLGLVALEPVPVVRVTVLDAVSGAPVEGARVILKQFEEGDPTGAVMRRNIEIDMEDPDHGSVQIGDGESRTARTDAEGVALITSFQGERCALEVRHRGHAPYHSDPFVPAVGKQDERVVRLLAGGRVTVVLQTPDGAPVPGGRVEHEAPGESADSWYFGADGGDGSNVADAEGRVVFDHLEAGTHRFRPADPNGGGLGFSTDGGARVRMRSSAVGLDAGPEDEGWTDALVSEGSEEEIVVLAPVRVAVFGRVYEAGEPLEGATVYLADPDDQSDPLMSMLRGGGGSQATTDGRGEYRLENVKAGEYVVRVTHPERHMPAELELRLGEEERRFDIDLTVAIVEGRVTDEMGKPVAGVRVWPERAKEQQAPQAVMIRVVAMADPGGGGEVVTVGDGGLNGPSAITDDKGFYQLRGVQEDVDLVVEAEGEAVQPGKSDIVQVTAGQVRRGVDITLAAAGRIQVQAFNGAGDPASNLLVTAVFEGEDSGDVDRKTDFIQRGGSVTLEGLTPGPWRVTVREMGSLTGGGSGGGIPDQRIEVMVGETATATFTVP